MSVLEKTAGTNKLKDFDVFKPFSVDIIPPTGDGRRMHCSRCHYWYKKLYSGAIEYSGFGICKQCTAFMRLAERAWPPRHTDILTHTNGIKYWVFYPYQSPHIVVPEVEKRHYELDHS